MLATVKGQDLAQSITCASDVPVLHARSTSVHPFSVVDVKKKKKKKEKSSYN